MWKIIFLKEVIAYFVQHNFGHKFLLKNCVSYVCEYDVRLTKPIFGSNWVTRITGFALAPFVDSTYSELVFHAFNQIRNFRFTLVSNYLNSFLPFGTGNYFKTF
jgi:hypothetical protein